ncbi:sulfotransferase [Microbulbifer bruguierae]|uniref:Sulfotransferase n=1 Tax=Microbulbifer bruguierae TaxID=3029061 RepID=A0ABY8NE46_9GAMM|nr:tetratricopeptide repeat-containing sulfotransferase family protein [Microbulbifer bruguierae]WGL16357.1 sulfotransferase [Microbulbifer bruguierae]
MNLSDDFLRQVAEARSQIVRGDYTSAEMSYRKLLATGLADEAIHQELLHLFMTSGDISNALATLNILCVIGPAVPDYHLELIRLAKQAGEPDICIAAYERYLELWPDKAESHFNLAWLLRQKGFLDAALTRYQLALDTGVTTPEEVYTNMAAICSDLRREEQAEYLLEEALAINSGYLPALFNLGGLMEERREKDEARKLYERILDLDPEYSAALCRIAHIERAHSGSDLPGRLRTLIESGRSSALEKEELCFALGKVLDDCACYDEAFVAFTEANRLGEKRLGVYCPDKHSSDIQQIIDVYRETYPIRSAADSYSPIFICGMFRSGSTLLEQILSGHSQLIAGGEIDTIPKIIGERGEEYPLSSSDLEQDQLERLAERYRQQNIDRFGVSEGVLDKRPDNFLYVGFIKQLFPRAKFLWTRRSLLDNCLSVYFQQLGGDMKYSTELESIAHYYHQQEKLMTFWESIFPGSICRVQYESLVSASELELRKVLDFLSLPFESECLNFSERSNYVKTASIWQVREGLHTRSCERSRHYQKFIQTLGA